MGWGFGGVGMVKLVRLQHLGVKSSVGRSLSRSAVRREFVRIGDEGGGPSGYQMDRIHGGNISPARQFMRLRSGSVGSDTVRLGVRLGLPKRVYERTTLGWCVLHFCSHTPHTTGHRGEGCGAQATDFYRYRYILALGPRSPTN